MAGRPKKSATPSPIEGGEVVEVVEKEIKEVIKQVSKACDKCNLGKIQCKTCVENK